MKQKYGKKIATVLFLALISVAAVGCQAEKQTVSSNHLYQPAVVHNDCRLQDKASLRGAMTEVRQNLSLDSCKPGFDRYFRELLTIATGDPSPYNKKQFSDFLLWSANNGVITKVQAKSLYNRYFSQTFMGLPDDYNVCSQCRNIDSIEQSIYEELGQKEKGLAEACGDKESYYNVRSQYESVLLFLDATCSACKDG